MTDRLEGKVALVTGSGRGFGRAIAIAFASEGANIVSVARSKDELLDAERNMVDVGGEVLTVIADLSNDLGIRKLFNETIDRYEGIDILVNNAATSPWLTIEELTIENWDLTMAVNLRAPFALSKLFYPSMEKRGGGSILNISSRSAEIGFVAELAYCPSKFGLEGLTQCLALELRPCNIAVNSLNVSSPPGKRLKPTEMSLDQADQMPDKIKVNYAKEKELVDQFKDAWVFLAEQDSSGITGMRLATNELSNVLKAGGAKAAYNKWRGKRVEAVYNPVEWPEKEKYQTKEGGWKELVF
ncbi:SDR family NAD(P)-dependent oxidoreductase [Candidatus Bathyarchaeota archaeon]|jgi:NAD(P)-dependent dehydrogenase (short-subunit alcohol dehydrogenase family)|nr:SDR family NAD(P)-dependent oxidoreductase [Candidatus Bathyarchaeota archaeon]